MSTKKFVDISNNVLPLHLKQTFPRIICIFTEFSLKMKGIGLNPGYLLKSFLLYIKYLDFLNNLKLVLNFSDLGNYTCEARNSYGTVRGTIQLESMISLLLIMGSFYFLLFCLFLVLVFCEISFINNCRSDLGN